MLLKCYIISLSNPEWFVTSKDNILKTPGVMNWFVVEGVRRMESEIRIKHVLGTILLLFPIPLFPADKSVPRSLDTPLPGWVPQNLF